jgi:phospholipid/cholesterol/gamma-HCH transport system substrate-binding protein
MTALREAARPAGPLPLRKRHPGGREVQVGLFVILGIAATLTALFTLTDAAMFRRRVIVKTVVTDAGGIRRGDPVLMRGVNIGRVNKFTIAHQGVEVRLEIEGEYPVPVDSRVELKANSLFGGMVADVVPGNSDEKAKNGAVLSGARAPGLMDSANSIADSSQAIVKRLQEAVAGPTVGNVERSSAELKELLVEARRLTNDEHRELLALTQSLHRSATSVEEVSNGGQIQRAAGSLETATASLERTSESLGRSAASLEAVMSRIDRGEGTLGHMTRDDALYQEIQKTIQNLNALVEDVKKNPKRYVKLSLF